MNQEKIGNFIKEIRKQNNLTQKELADKLGVTYQAVSKWETGLNIPDIGIIRQISKMYNVDINEILGNNEQPENISFILVILFVFHFEISGNNEHPENIPLILVTLFVFHFEILGNDDNDEHL